MNQLDVDVIQKFRLRVFCLGWNNDFFPGASLGLTLCRPDSMASSRSRLRLCFSARGRGEGFD